MRIAVAGATGVVGRQVVAAAEAAGHRVVPLARSTGVDLTTGRGLTGVLDGVEAVVDTTSVASQRRATAERFFTDVTRHLHEAEVAAGVGHHVALSIVGIDDIGLGYYLGKRRQEQLVADGPVPWSILRATQFHEFAGQVLDFMRLGPVSLVASMPTQTVAAAEVGAALVRLCEAGPSGRVQDLGGPEENQVVDLARRYVRATGGRQKVVGLRVPGAAGRAIRAGRLRPAAGTARGTQTFTEWLSAL